MLDRHDLSVFGAGGDAQLGGSPEREMTSEW